MGRGDSRGNVEVIAAPANDVAGAQQKQLAQQAVALSRKTQGGRATNSCRHGVSGDQCCGRALDRAMSVRRLG
jgi:hypothetical protein